MLSHSKSLLFRCVALLAAIAAASSTCTTGPSIQRATSTFIPAGFQYIEASSSVECSGVIVRWHFCHLVVDDRLQEKQLWAGIWRADGDLFRLVGLNKLLIDPPGFFSSLIRCLNYTVPSEHWIETQDGDFVGHFTPDNNGAFISITTDPDDRYRRRRVLFGYTEVLNTSELNRIRGRSLVKAEIGRRKHINFNIHS